MEKTDIQICPACYCTASGGKTIPDAHYDEKTAATETDPLNATATRPWSAFKGWYWI